jgi:hypothetical protein
VGYNPGFQLYLAAFAAAGILSMRWIAHPDTHSKVIGYLLWIFGFTGAHRFSFGKPITGTIWFFTGGLLLIGWIIDRS